MKKIIFQHLAKTAGTSLIRSLQTCFPDQTCSARYDPELTPELMTDSRFVFYHGHFSFDKVQEFKTVNPGAFAFVFLRHPVNRVLSQYYNWVDAERTREEYAAIKNRGGFPDAEINQKLDKFESTIFSMTLAQFLESKDTDIVDVVLNHQTRYMSLRSVYEANPLLGCLNAVENITSFYDFVGLMETYSHSVERLRTVLGVEEGTLGEVRVNTNDNRKVSGHYRESREAILQIVARNTFDLSIFHYALARAVAQIPGASISDLLSLPEMT